MSQGWLAFFVDNLTDELALLPSTRSGAADPVGYLTNRPRAFGVSKRIDS